MFSGLIICYWTTNFCLLPQTGPISSSQICAVSCSSFGLGWGWGHVDFSPSNWMHSLVFSLFRSILAGHISKILLVRLFILLWNIPSQTLWSYDSSSLSRTLQACLMTEPVTRNDTFLYNNSNVQSIQGIVLFIIRGAPCSCDSLLSLWSL